MQAIETLSQTQQLTLDRDGYVIYSGLIPDDQLPTVRGIFEDQAAKMNSAGGTRHADFERIAAIQSLRSHPMIVATVRHILGEGFKSAPLHGRDPLPGFGQQGLHADAPPRTGRFQVATAIWMLDDYTGDNGVTRIVPGTHVLPRPVPKAIAAPERHHRGEILVMAPAGSVLLFNGHLWHSGTRNRSTRSRRVLQGIYHRPEFFYWQSSAR